MEGLVSYLKTPNWRRQLGWRGGLWRLMSRLGLTGLYALPMNRRWVEFQRRSMPLERLDAAYNGFKIVQISDLHHSPVVSARYLVQYVRWINELQPDLVVVTGDLITGGYRFAHRIATILSHLRARHGTVCTFGNHDYSIHGKRNLEEGQRRGGYLEKCLQDRGLIVLRNERLEIRRAMAATPLVIVGLDDEWSGAIDAERAFAGLDPSLPIICLNHNPVNTRELLRFPWQWMLAGHTHGRQVGTSKVARSLAPKLYRHFTHGYYNVEGRHLYVNRGLSYGQRVLDWCRPEVTIFKLKADDALPIVR